MRPFAAGVCWWAVCGPGASGPFLQSSECPWNSLCHGVPLSPALGMQTRALMIILPQGSTEGERKDLWVWKWKQYSVSGTSVVGELESGGFCLLVFPSRLSRPFLQKFWSHSSFISQHSNSPVGGRLFPSHDKLFSVRIQICLFKSDHLWWIYSVNMGLNRSNRG